MTTIHNLGFPRIGAKRELKFSLEKYWRKELSAEGLLTHAQQLRGKNWQIQQELDFVPVDDFSLYDHVLDTSSFVGNIPERVSNLNGEQLEQKAKLNAEERVFNLNLNLAYFI